MARTSIAKRTTAAVQHRYTLEEMLVQINAHIYDANQAEARCHRFRLKAGSKLLTLRQRIEAGEAGEISWWDWFEKLKEDKIPVLIRSRKDCERLMRLASADDPLAALEAEQAKDRDRKRIARSYGADVRSISRQVGAGCCSGTFVTVVEGSTPHYRRSDAEIGRDKFLSGFIGAVLAIGTTSFGDAAFDLLTMEQKANAIEDIEKAMASLRKMIDQLSA